MAVKKIVLADGTVRWRVRHYVGIDPDTGRREIITKTFDKKKAADTEAAKLRMMKEGGVRVRPSKETLGKYLERWIKEVKEGEIRARTLHDYKGYVRRYITHPPPGTPPIGKVQLNRLTPAAFQTLYDHLWRELDLAPRTIQYLHTILRQALGHAVLVGSLARNPTDGVKPKKQRREGKAENGQQVRKIRAMSESEAQLFLAKAQEDRYHALWSVLLAGGIRPGEALGLEWGDVDFDGGKIHVQRSLTRLGVEGWKLTEPKTNRARRVVPLPSFTMAALKEWRTQQVEERLLLGSEYQDHGFVFSTEFGAPLDGANLNNRHFKRILAAAELGEWIEKKGKKTFKPGFRMYDLRHTCATLLLLKGENPKVVSERLGHASITLTLDTYSHVLPDMQGAAVEKMEAMFG